MGASFFKEFYFVTVIEKKIMKNLMLTDKTTTPKLNNEFIIPNMRSECAEDRFLT